MEQVLHFVYAMAALLGVVTLHEYAHAWMANFLGDPTAKNNGRLSLNPMAHLDWLGVILMFLIGIGWGKPVPVNRNYFNRPRVGEAMVALAGPVMNLLIALVVMIPIKYFAVYISNELLLLLATIMDVSIVLFAFNMLPIPPLDGSKVLQILVPKKWRGHYEWYLAETGMWFFVFLLVDNFIFAKYFNFSVLSWLVGSIATIVKALLFWGG